MLHIQLGLNLKKVYYGFCWVRRLWEDVTHFYSRCSVVLHWVKIHGKIVQHGLTTFHKTTQLCGEFYQHWFSVLVHIFLPVDAEWIVRFSDEIMNPSTYLPQKSVFTVVQGCSTCLVTCSFFSRNKKDCCHPGIFTISSTT